MNSKLVWQNAGARTFVLVLDAGEEAFRAICEFATSRCLNGATLSAVGGFEHVIVGWFDVKNAVYRPIEIRERCERVSLTGSIGENVAGRPFLHLHASLILRDGRVRGGHFLAGIVRPSLEVTMVEDPTYLRRRHPADLGIALLDVAASQSYSV